MYSVKISIHRVHDHEEVSASIVRQRKRGDAWINEEEITHLSKDPERNILLADDQRIMVSGTSNTRVVFDKEQMAAVPEQRPVMERSTPLDTDGDELSPPVPAVDRALSGPELARLQEEERRAQAITEARNKVNPPKPVEGTKEAEQQKEKEAEKSKGFVPPGVKK